MAEKLQVMTYENLVQYDGLIKAEIDKKVSAGVAKSIKTVALDGKVLKFYTVEEPVGSTAPVYSLTLPETDISGLMQKLSGATAGNLVKVAADGVNVEDAGVAVDDVALKADVEQKQAAMQSDIDGAKSKLDKLIGEDANKSARTIANEELAKQLIPENAKDSLDTLNEIAAWIQNHPDDATAMNKAIEDLKKLVGTLPEGVSATNVVEYIAEVKAALEASIVSAKNEAVSTAATDATTKANKALEDAKKYTDAEVAKDRARLDAAESDIDSLEQKVATLEANGYDDTAVRNLITANKDAIAAEKTRAEGIESGLRTDVDAIKEDYLKAADKTEMTSNISKNATAIAALEAKVGEGFEAIPSASIAALFA